MALKKTAAEHKGTIIPNAYFKIKSTTDYDYDNKDGHKKYGVNLTVEMYYDDTKSWLIDSDRHLFNELDENDLKRSHYYLLLKTKDKFKDTVDC